MSDDTTDDEQTNRTKSIKARLRSSTQKIRQLGTKGKGIVTKGVRIAVFVLAIQVTYAAAHLTVKTIAFLGKRGVAIAKWAATNRLVTGFSRKILLPALVIAGVAGAIYTAYRYISTDSNRLYDRIKSHAPGRRTTDDDDATEIEVEAHQAAENGITPSDD